MKVFKNKLIKYLMR